MLLEVRQLTPTQFADAIGIARPIVSHILSGRNKPSLEVVQRILAAMPDLSMSWLLNGNGPMLAHTVLPTATVPLNAPLNEAASQSLRSVVPAESQIVETGEQANYASGLPKKELPVSPSATLVDTGPTQTSRSRRSTPEHESTPKLTPTPAMDKSTPQFAKVLPRRFAAAPPPSNPGPPSTSSIAPPPAPIPAPVEPTNDTAEAIAIPVAPPAALPQTNTPPGPNATAAALFAGAEKPIRRIVIFYRDGSFADYQPE